MTRTEGYVSGGILLALGAVSLVFGGLCFPFLPVAVPLLVLGAIFAVSGGVLFANAATDGTVFSFDNAVSVSQPVVAVPGPTVFVDPAPAVTYRQRVRPAPVFVPPPVVPVNRCVPVPGLALRPVGRRGSAPAVRCPAAVPARVPAPGAGARVASRGLAGRPLAPTRR